VKTAELVRYAEFVISHQRTSTRYAVLNYKPIIFFYTDEMKSFYNDTWVSEIKNLSRFLDLRPLKINSLANPKSNMLTRVNKKNYDKYIADFTVSKRAKQLSTIEVFISKVTKLCASERKLK
jgi:hypothetical protein